MSYFYESRSCYGDDREIFATIIEDSLEFYHVLLQHCVKFEVASKLQITSNNIVFSFSFFLYLILLQL